MPMLMLMLMPMHDGSFVERVPCFFRTNNNVQKKDTHKNVTPFIVYSTVYIVRVHRRYVVQYSTVVVVDVCRCVIV